MFHCLHIKRKVWIIVPDCVEKAALKWNSILFSISVRPSKEPGWLEGYLNGKRGLIPENYVEFIDWKCVQLLCNGKFRKQIIMQECDCLY